LALIGRGFADTLDHLLPFTLITLAWWVSVLTVILGPGGTVALFAATDPRRAVDRPEWQEIVAIARANLLRGWAMALVTGVPLVILIVNLTSYASTESRWRWLMPIWTYLLLFGLLAALYAFAMTPFAELSLRQILRNAALLVAVAPLRAALVALVIGVIISIGSLLVVPLVMFLPALIAAIVNRVVLAGLGIPVVDPLAPTEEREAERRAAASSSRFGP
jgi:uncharacterized membrane protein YesL